MKQRFTAVISLALLGVPSCTTGNGRNGEAEASDSLTVRDVLIANTASQGSPLYTSASDRVLLTDREGEDRLVWQIEEGTRWRELWRSRPLHGAAPDVQIDDLDRRRQARPVLGDGL